MARRSEITLDPPPSSKCKRNSKTNERTWENKNLNKNNKVDYTELRYAIAFIIITLICIRYGQKTNQIGFYVFAGITTIDTITSIVKYTIQIRKVVKYEKSKKQIN